MSKKTLNALREEFEQPGPPQTGQDIARLTEEKVKALTNEERFETLQLAVKSIREEEEAGQYDNVKALLDKLELICSHTSVIGGAEDMRRQIWEDNHSRILATIHNFVIEHNRMPGINEIGRQCKLSRQTVHEHLRDGIAGRYYQEQLKRMEYLTDSVLKTLYNLAIKGNVAASKVFLDNVLKSTQPTTIRQQTNYVQVNNTKIDEVLISELPATARLQIEDIVKQYTNKVA